MRPRAFDTIKLTQLWSIKNKHSFQESHVDTFLRENEFIKDKKLLSISPGGYKGFYMLGVCKFIKEKYDLENYIFSGASAGAWNSLMLCFNRNISELQRVILDSDIQTTKTIFEIENRIKQNLISTYNSSEFDLRRLFIGVTTAIGCKTNTTIFSGFENLEDAINCCIASSHIPLVTGGLRNVYRNQLTFDGGFSKYPYLSSIPPVLHITPNIWRYGNYKTMVNKPLTLSDYANFFTKEEDTFDEMIEKGYSDSMKNREQLDSVFYT
jgi:hypothetical protein